MQDRAEYFTSKVSDAINPDDGWRRKATCLRHLSLPDEAAVPGGAGDMLINAGFCVSINNRAYIGITPGRIP